MKQDDFFLNRGTYLLLCNVLPTRNYSCTYSQDSCLVCSGSVLHTKYPPGYFVYPCDLVDCIRFTKLLRIYTRWSNLDIGYENNMLLHSVWFCGYGFRVGRNKPVVNSCELALLSSLHCIGYFNMHRANLYL